MRQPLALSLCAAALLAACVESPTVETGPNAGFLAELPESVVAIAAGAQDLSAVKLDPVDGCYVYRHQGPVETTLLPLRAKNGRPICTR